MFTILNFVIENTIDENFIENIKKINFKLLDLKSDETNTYNLSFEVYKLDQYQELKKLLSKCGKIQKSEFIL